jgi:hypothetical protein
MRSSYSRPHYGENLFTISSSSSTGIIQKLHDDDDDENTKLLAAKKSEGFLNLVENQQHIYDSRTTSAATIIPNMSAESIAPNYNVNENANNNPSAIYTSSDSDENNTTRKNFVNKPTKCCQFSRPLLKFHQNPAFKVNLYIRKILFCTLIAFLVMFSSSMITFFFERQIRSILHNNNNPRRRRRQDSNTDYLLNLIIYLKLETLFYGYLGVFFVFFIFLLHYPLLRSKRPWNFILSVIYVLSLSGLVCLIMLNFNLNGIIQIIPGVILIIICLILFTLQTKIQFNYSFSIPYCLTLFVLCVAILVYSLTMKFVFNQIVNLLANAAVYILIISFYIIFDLQYILSLNYKYNTVSTDADYLFKAFNMFTVDVFNVPVLIFKFVFRFVR